MYILSWIAIIISPFFITASFHAGFPSSSYFVDFPSLLILFILCIPIFISARLTKDFNLGLQILFKKGKQYNLSDLKRSVEAVDLAMKTFLYGGLFILMFSAIVILHTTNDPAALGPYLSTAFYSFLYALTFHILLLPIRARLKVKSIDYIQE